MDTVQIVSLMRAGITQVLLLTAPVLAASLIVGLIIAIFQATTSIQEQTLTFVPKLFAILGVLALLGGWMFTELEGYTTQLFRLIPSMAG